MLLRSHELRFLRLATLAALSCLLVLGGCPPGGVVPDPANTTGSGDIPDAWTGDAGNGDDDAVAGATDERVAGFEVDPSRLDFADEATQMSFELRSVVDVDIAYLVTASQTWASLSPSSGTLAARGSQTITVTIDRSTFLPGGYSADIDVSADGFLPARVTLDATSGGAGGGGVGDGPELHVSTSTLDFGSTALSRSFLVRNAGDGEMSFVCSADTPWITFAAAEGTSSGQYRTVRVYVSRDGLSSGDYAGVVTVRAGEQQAQIGVTMHVPTGGSGGGGSSPPNLEVNRTELIFGATQRRLTILLRNTGAGDLNYTAQSSENWATPTPMFGVARRTYSSVGVVIDRTGLSPGDYEAVLAISAANGQRHDVTLRMTVPNPPAGGGSDPPSLVVSANSLDFGASTTQTSFTMRNAGGGTLNFTLTTDQSWLSATPTSGVVSPTVTVVRVNVDRTGLAEDMYSGMVSIATDAGITFDVQVAMQVGDGASDYDPPPTNPVGWPTSDEQIASIGGLQQYAAEGIGGRYGYPPERWAYAPVHLWMSIPYQDGYDPAWQQSALVERLVGYNPEAMWLMAISGSATRHSDHMTTWPGEMIAYDLLPPDYYLGPYDNSSYDRALVDMDNDAARALLSDLIVQDALSRNCRGVFLDNIVHGSSGGTRASWTEMTDYLRSITQRLNEHGKLTVANIAVVPEALTYLGGGADDERTASALNGTCFEMPFHWDLTRPYFDKVRSEINMYRRWLDGGMHIELLPAWSTVVWDQTLRNAEARVLAAMVMMIRRPGDSICVTRSYYEELPDWVFWPEAFGAALDDYTITLLPVVLTREFENATISVNLHMSMDPTQSVNAVTVTWR